MDTVLDSTCSGVYRYVVPNSGGGLRAPVRVAVGAGDNEWDSIFLVLTNESEEVLGRRICRDRIDLQQIGIIHARSGHVSGSWVHHRCGGVVGRAVM